MKKIFKKYFLAGLAVLMPLVVTYLILKFLILSADALLLSFIPERFWPSNVWGIDIPGLGLIAILVLIIFIGMFTRQYLGKKLFLLGDRLISKIPIGAGIYNATKQFMNTFISDKEQQFKGVVVVEYPRRGSWVMGFITRNPDKRILNIDERNWTTVFIPTTPNPTSGFLIMVPLEETKPLDISTDEAFKFIVSAGYLQGNGGDSVPLA
jgi:uncharacterized membrane protein